MEAQWKCCTPVLASLLVLTLSAGVHSLTAQQPASAPDSTASQGQSDPLADLSPENRALFDALRNAAQQGDDAGAFASGKKLLPVLKPNTRLWNFVTQVTAGSALEMGDAAYAISLLKPFTEVNPEDWRAASLLARSYAETGAKVLRDQQIARVIALHNKTKDPDFAKLHIFPIQKVKLHSGFAIFLYPFEPEGKFNIHLVALVYTSDGKESFRIQLESDDADQAFFKPKHPGERRFSIDTYSPGTDGKAGETQALHGFLDGVFDYDVMRDRMVDVANGGQSPNK
ncbi:MAG TPA: hypothetical protein VGJ21_22895 [Terracidiphilus sp.]|jgi:hypothetical protein